LHDWWAVSNSLYETLEGLNKFNTFTKFDDLFFQAREILEACEGIRGDLEDHRENGEQISNTFKLEEPKLADMLKVLMWSLSALTDGKITELGIKPTAESPYIKFDDKKPLGECIELIKAFQGFVKTVTDSPSIMQENISKLEELVKTTPDAFKDASEELKTSSLGFKAKMDAGLNMKKNMTKLPKEVAKVKKVFEALKEAALELKETAPQIPGIISSADQTGSKAAAEKVFKPAFVFDKFHPGTRKQETAKDNKAEAAKGNKGKATEENKPKAEVKA